MSNRTEVEIKYYLKDDNKLLKIIDELQMEKTTTDIEIDEYFTDIDEEFIRNRTCLRIRRTNNIKMELTFKGKSKVLDNLYAKNESNLPIDINYHDNLVSFLNYLGFKKYVEVNKKRTTYTKAIDNLTYNIMLDEIKNAGKFLELEILTKEDNISTDILKEKLIDFSNKFKELNLEEAKLPYRDIVANIKKEK